MPRASKQDAAPPQPMQQTVLPQLFPEQAAIAIHPARFRVASCGRGGGKSTMAAAEVLFEAIVHGATCLWCVPKAKNAVAAWDDLTNWCYNNIPSLKPGKGIYKDDALIRLPHPSGNPLQRWGSISVLSLHEADNHRGGQADLIVFDECAYQPDDYAWNMVLQPKLTTRSGRAIFISTPRGRNWFYNIFQYAKNQAELGNKDWIAFQKPSWILNPMITPEEVQRLRDTLPPLVFQQEFEAKFVDGASSVFWGIEEALLKPHEVQLAPIDGHTYVAGVDWGHGLDYSSVSVIDVNESKEVFVEHKNIADFPTIYSWLESVFTRWHVSKACIEHNSIGVRPGEEFAELMRGRTSVELVNMNTATKNPIVDSLRLAIGNLELKILDVEYATEELLAYEVNVLSTGYVQYSAARGAHDDTVIARCMAYRALTGQRITTSDTALGLVRPEGLYANKERTTRRGELVSSANLMNKKTHRRKYGSGWRG